MKVETIFEFSRVKTHFDFKRIYLMRASKKGISSHQRHSTLGTTLKTT